MGTPTDDFIRLLTSRHRVVVLGGLAVIAHGYSRSTYDGDIWLDPMDSPPTWAASFASVVDEFGGLTMNRLPGWTQVNSSEIADAIEESRVIRILGLDCPLGVFRQPNETATELFDEVFARGFAKADGTILPDPLDLIRSKLDTGRDKDQQDILFLESLVRADYKKRLPIATLVQ